MAASLVCEKRVVVQRKVVMVREGCVLGVSRARKEKGWWAPGAPSAMASHDGREEMQEVCVDGLSDADADQQRDPEGPRR